VTNCTVSALSQQLFAEHLGGLSHWPRPLDIVGSGNINDIKLGIQRLFLLFFFFFFLQKSFKLKFKRLFVELSVLVVQNGAHPFKMMLLV